MKAFEKGAKTKGKRKSLQGGIIYMKICNDCLYLHQNKECELNIKLETNKCKSHIDKYRG